MNKLIDRILMAYRPLYLRGLLMDGQYRLPVAETKPPIAGSKVIQLVPAFEPKRRRVLRGPAATTAGLVAGVARSSVSEMPLAPTAKSTR